MENTNATVSLIPGGCPQFLDFTLSIAQLPRLRRYFREEKKLEQASPTQGRYNHYLRCLEEEADGFIDQLTGTPCDHDYDMDIRRVLDRKSVV